MAITFDLRTKLLSAFLLMAVFTFITGWAGIHFSSKISHFGEHIGLELAPLGVAVQEVKYNAKEAHLLIEKMLSDDARDEMQGIWGFLDNATAYCDLILQGGESEKGVFIATNNPEIRKIITKVKESVQVFNESSRTWYAQRPDASSVGSESDHEFDEQYGFVQEGLSSILENFNQPEYLSIVNQAGQAKFELANGHLFFEELIAGDESNRMEDIQALFKTARDNIGQIEDQVLDNKNLSAAVDDFILLSGERYRNYVDRKSSSSHLERIFKEEFVRFSSLAHDADVVIRKSINSGVTSLQQRDHEMVVSLITISIGGLVAALVLALIMIHLIITPIRKSIKVAKSIAEGNLGIDIKSTSSDETGQLLLEMKRMTGVLDHIVNRVKGTANGVSTGSVRLGSTSQEVFRGVSELAASVQETNAAMGLVNSKARQTATNALETENTALKVANDAEESGRAVSNALTALKEIAGKVTVMEDIAVQTKILSLNASIEAAAAGEHGKGFAVIALEVRKLAEMSKKSANDILQLSASSMGVAQKAGDMLNRLIPDIQNTSVLVREISSASDEQLGAVIQISATLEELGSIIELNSRASKDMESTSKKLSSQATDLQDAIAFFKQTAASTLSS